jgi:hypothetical protein
MLFYTLSSGVIQDEWSIYPDSGGQKALTLIRLVTFTDRWCFAKKYTIVAAVLGVEDDALKVEEVDALEIWRKMIHWTYGGGWCIESGGRWCIAVLLFSFGMWRF